VGTLRDVHRDVGLAQDRRRIGAVARNRDADARSDDQRLAGDAIGRDERFDDALGDRLGLDETVPGQENREFVAAQTRHQIVVAHFGFEPACDLAEQRVTPVMAERVVDVFETVEVDEQDRKGMAAVEGDR